MNFEINLKAPRVLRQECDIHTKVDFFKAHTSN